MESLVDVQAELGGQVTVGRTLVVNPETCTGCHYCELICSLVHEGECNFDLSRIAIFKTQGGGTHENLPVVCQQCLDPVCAEVCPEEAISRDEETGLLSVNEDSCTGCQTCVNSCPVGGMLYHPANGCAMNCDLCGGDPECVKHCSYDAIEYLPLSESERKAQLQKIEDLAKLYNISHRS